MYLFLRVKLIHFCAYKNILIFFRYRYIKDSTDSSICKPQCKNGCTNGHCSAPEVCTCSSGYKLQNGVCVPHCEEECVNSKCVAPNTCLCNPDYEPDEFSKCSKVCNPICINGKCVDGKCECKELWSGVDCSIYLFVEIAAE